MVFTTALFLSSSIIRQGEVELLTLKVGADHLDADGITQLVFRVMAATNDDEVLLVEVVVVVAEVTDGDHTLTMRLVNLGIDTIRGETADMGIVSVADLIRHKLHHLILDRVALGILGDLFHL